MPFSCSTPRLNFGEIFARKGFLSPVLFGSTAEKPRSGPSIRPPVSRSAVSSTDHGWKVFKLLQAGGGGTNQ